MTVASSATTGTPSGRDEGQTAEICSNTSDGEHGRPHVFWFFRHVFCSGPPGLKLEGADQAVATATGLRVGRYTFRLTVSDQEGASDSASLTARVQEGERVCDIRS